MSTSSTAVLASEGIRVGVAPDRGGQIRSLSNRDTVNVLFDADWTTPVPASVGTTYGDDEHDWLSEWRGRWQEQFPSADTPTSVFSEARVPRRCVEWSVGATRSRSPPSPAKRQ